MNEHKLLSDIKKSGCIGVYVVEDKNGNKSVLTQSHGFSSNIPEIVVYSPYDDMKELHSIRMKKYESHPIEMKINDFMSLFENHHVLFAHTAIKREKQKWFDLFIKKNKKYEMKWFTFSDFKDCL